VIPVIDTGYLSDSDDVDVEILMEGVALTRRITAHEALARLVEHELPDSAAIVDRPSARAACLHYYHPVGTCRMGPASDPMAVVDASGTVHGCGNLTVADASIMPTIPRANTNLPTLALAEKIVAALP
jgi:choline dehydrogenase